MSQAVTFLEHHDVEVPFLFFAQLLRKKKKLRSQALRWDEFCVGMSLALE